MSETKAQCLEKAARGEGCLGRSQDDEPVFVLCARDVTAAKFVRLWAQDAAIAGRSKQKVSDAQRAADDMDTWRAVNRKKVPD